VNKTQDFEPLRKKKFFSYVRRGGSIQLVLFAQYVGVEINNTIEGFEQTLSISVSVNS